MGVLTGPAPVTWRHTGTVPRIKASRPVPATHRFFIHQEQLASQQVVALLHEVLSQVVSIVNRVK